MGTKLSVMDMELDLLSEETFESQLLEYLSNDSLNMVHLVSIEYTEVYDNEEFLREELTQADLVIPGEKSILAMHHVDVLEAGEMVVDYNGFVKVAEKLPLDQYTYYVITEDKRAAKIIFEFLVGKSSKENVVGVISVENIEDSSAMINDINMKLPDVIILLMSPVEQEQWLNENKKMLNAKLCVAMGSIMPIVKSNNIYVPKMFRALHLSKLYRKIAGTPYSGYFRRKRFKKQMDRYHMLKKFE